MSGDDSNKVEQLNLNVISQDGQLIQFKVKQSMPFRKLMNAYCQRQKLVLTSMRFIFDGNRLRESDTPKDLEMEDGDTIEVFSQQTGGVGGPYKMSANPSVLINSWAFPNCAHRCVPR